MKLFSNNNTYLQISGEKMYKSLCLLTSGENCVPSTFLNMNERKKNNQKKLKYLSSASFKASSIQSWASGSCLMVMHMYDFD